MESVLPGGLRRWLAASLLVWAAATAAQSDWMPELVTPPDGEHGPSAELRLRLPADLPEALLQRLSLELDGLDISALVTRDGDQVVFAPPQPLTPGRHVLRLVEYSDDGGILERGQWSFEVAGSRLFESAQLRMNGVLNLSQRAADHNLDTPAPDRLQADGGLSFDAVLGDRHWQAQARADLLYNRDADRMPRGESPDLNEYLLSVQAGPAFASLGHHAVGQDSLVMSGFNRRGVSAGASLLEERLRVAGFALRTETIVGFPHGLGFTDPGNRVGGLTAAYSPLSRPELLTLSATHVEGRGAQAGMFEWGGVGPAQGTATSLAADSLLLDRRLRLRAEFARSDFDFDGRGGYGANRDHAHSLLAAYSLPATQVGDQMLTWTVGARHQRIGTFYRSLANPHLPSDRRLEQVFGDLNWGGFSSSLALGRETDNVEDLAGIPTVRTDHLIWRNSYTPLPADGASTSGLFARPSYGVILGYTRQSDTDNPAGPEFATDRRSRDLQLSVMFHPGDWSWGGGYGLTRFDDDGIFGGDSRSQQLYAMANVPLGRRLILAPQLQLGRVDDLEQGLERHNVLARLGLQAALIPDRLNASAGISVNRDRTDDGGYDQRTVLLDLGLRWTVVAARDNRPGLDLLLSGSYQDVNDRAGGLDSDLYQVFAGVSMTLPLQR